MNAKQQLTEEGLKKYKDELDKLINVDRVKNIEDLKDARAQGDLSENADYDAARDEQRRIEERIKELEAIIKNAVIIDESKTSSSNLGKSLTIFFEDTEETETYTIVGSLESDPLNGKISNESPLGAAIIKAKVGQRILIKTETDEFFVTIKNIK